MENIKRREFLKLSAVSPAGIVALSPVQLEFEKLANLSPDKSAQVVPLENKNTLILTNYGTLDILLANLIRYEFDMVYLRNFFDLRPGQSAQYAIGQNGIEIVGDSNLVGPNSVEQQLQLLRKANKNPDHSQKYIIRALASELTTAQIQQLKEEFDFQIIAHSFTDAHLQIQTYLNREDSKVWHQPVLSQLQQGKTMAMSDVPLRWIKDFVKEQKELICHIEKLRLPEINLDPVHSYENVKSITQQFGFVKDPPLNLIWSNAIFKYS